MSVPIEHSIDGRVVRVGDNVDTDVIIAGPYLNLTDPRELGAHLLETYDPELSAGLAAGDVLVAGENFGLGSSREQAPIAILGRGISAVIAASFARIFLRNAINLGLPAIESRAAAAALRSGERVRIDLRAGEIVGESSGSFTVPPSPPFLAAIIDAGGLVPWVRARLASTGVQSSPPSERSGGDHES
jgi:3-isopropylmalate/(R)-2-methylmalate dehydratase small subunit